MAGRAVLAALALLSAVAFPAQAQAQAVAPCVTPADAPSHAITMTPRLGLYFYQSGERIRLTIADHPAAQPIPIVSTVRLRRAPFEIRIPASSWSDEAPDAGLWVSVSDETCFEDQLQLGGDVEETTLFGRYRAMADYQYGAGRLISARAPPDHRHHDDYGWNNVIDRRFNASGDGYRGFLVSRIDRRFAEEDLMMGDDVVTLVFYLDRRSGRPATIRDENGEHDVIDTQEVDVVRIVFED